MRILLGFILTLSVSFAQDCTKIEVDSERLACYDKQVEKNKVVNIDKGRWVIESEISPLDDTKTVILFLEGEDKITTRIGVTVVPTLILRCQSNKTEAYISWETFLGSRSVAVTYRVNKEKAVNTQWGISNDGKGSFISKPIDFIKKILDKEDLFVQITPYASNPISTKFILKGIQEGIKPLREACNW